MAERSTHRAAVIIGFILFLVGAAALIAIFLLAYGVFSSALTSSKTDHFRLGELAGRGVQLAALLVMAYAASLLCARGIQLFSAARGTHE